MTRIPAATLAAALPGAAHASDLASVLEREVLARPHGPSGLLVVFAAFALASAAAYAWFRLFGGGSGDEGASE